MEHIDMLTGQQRQALADDGLMKIPQAIPADVALTMAARIGGYLTTEKSVSRNASQAWLAERPAGLRPLTKAGVFDAAAADSVESALAELYGPGRYPRPTNGGRAAVTYKVSDAPWDVPTAGWHVDSWPGPQGEDPAGVTVFTVLAPLRPGGGGTLVLAGSYRLLRAHPPASMAGKHRLPAVRRELGERHPWLAELWGSAQGSSVDRRQRYLDEGAVLDGVPLRVVEVTGEPGDAFVMRHDTFHTLAPNSLDQPRMMLIKTWMPAGSESEDD
jgi:hypothetical protein